MNTYRVQVPFQRPVYTSHLTRFPAVSTPFHTRFNAISNTLNKRHFTLLPPPFQRRFNAVSRRFNAVSRRFNPPPLLLGVSYEELMNKERGSSQN